MKKFVLVLAFVAVLFSLQGVSAQDVSRIVAVCADAPEQVLVSADDDPDDNVVEFYAGYTMPDTDLCLFEGESVHRLEYPGNFALAGAYGGQVIFEQVEGSLQLSPETGYKHDWGKWYLSRVYTSVDLYDLSSWQLIDDCKADESCSMARVIGQLVYYYAGRPYEDNYSLTSEGEWRSYDLVTGERAVLEASLPPSGTDGPEYWFEVAETEDCTNCVTFPDWSKHYWRFETVVFLEDYKLVNGHGVLDYYLLLDGGEPISLCAACSWPHPDNDGGLYFAANDQGIGYWDAESGITYIEMPYLIKDVVVVN